MKFHKINATHRLVPTMHNAMMVFVHVCPVYKVIRTRGVDQSVCWIAIVPEIRLAWEVNVWILVRAVHAHPTHNVPCTITYRCAPAQAEWKETHSLNVDQLYSQHTTNTMVADPLHAENSLNVARSMAKQFVLVYLVTLAVPQHAIQSVLSILTAQVMKRARIRFAPIPVLALAVWTQIVALWIIIRFAIVYLVILEMLFLIVIQSVRVFSSNNFVL